MNTTIQNWIDQIDSGSTISLSGFSQVLDNFPGCDFTYVIPQTLLPISNLQLNTVIIEKDEDNDDSIISVTFEISTPNVWTFHDTYYKLTEINVTITVFYPDNETSGATVAVNGKLSLENGPENLPVVLESDPEADGEEADWIVSLDAVFDDNIVLSFEQVEALLQVSGIKDRIPAYFGEFDQVPLFNLKLVFPFTLDSVKNGTFVINYGSWPVIEELQIRIDLSLIHVNVPMPYDPVTTTIEAEGVLYAGDVRFPLVLVQLPDEYHHEVIIQVNDDEYTFADLSDINALQGEGNIIDSFLPGLSDFNGLNLTSFYMITDDELSGIDYLSFSLSPNEDEESTWEIIPSVLSMRDISFEYKTPPTEMTFAGIVGLGTKEIPMAATYTIPEDGAQPDECSIYMNTWGDIESVSIGLNDLSVLGFALTDLLPGLDQVAFEMTDFVMNFSVAETISLTAFEFTVEHNEMWNIVPFVTLGNYTLHFEYVKGVTDEEEDSWQVEVTGILDINIEGAEQIPVQLTIPDEGDWCLEFAGDDESGVALPGLQGVTSLLGIGLEDIIPDVLGFEGIQLIDLAFWFPHPSEGKLSSMFVSIQKETVWSVEDIFSFTNFKYNIDIDYTGSETAVDGAIACTFTLGDLILPVLMPLPFNEHEWTLQLDSPAQLPSLSYFSGLAGFDANNLLAELTGFSGIPGIIVSRFDIKFDTDPYKTRKLAIAADFSSSVSITLPPGLEVRLDSLLFEMDDESGELALQNFTAYGAVVETIGKTTTLPVQLTRTPATWEMAINTEEGEAISIDGKFFDSITPGLPLPSSLDDTGFDITGIHMVATHDMELVEFSVYTTITSPNAIFGLDIFIDEIPIRIIYDNSEAEGRWGIQVLEWPFNTGGFKYLQREGWILLDLWEFGAIKLKLPTFYPQGDNFVLNGALETTHDGEEVILQNGDIFTGIDLNIPVKALFDKMGLSFFNTFFPDRIPLTPSIDLRETIRDLEGNPDNLPDAMQDYLDIEVPDSAEFDVFISSSGDVSVKVKIFQEELDLSKPVKIIMPAGAFIVGIKVFSIGFTYIKGVPFFTIDAEMDLFVTILLIALTWFEVDQIPPLPNFKKVHTKFSMLDVWFLLATGFPLPLFYDELSVHYFGLEGINAGSVINLPKPMPSLYDFSVIGNIMTQLKKFLTEKDYFLDEDEFTFGGADLEFTMGPQFIELPAYVGDPTIGTKDNVFTQSISDILCHILNTLKDPSLSRFFKLIPQEYRYKDMDIEFGPMELKMAVGFTTPLEFYTENPTGFSRSLMNHLFPDLANETLITAGDSETELPEPRHYLQCSENTGSVITDRITGMQLAGDDCKTLNWQREDIKGYRDRIYIQSSSDADLTSIVCGDLIDEPYAQYTITFLAKIDTTVNGCLLSSSGEVSVWYYDGYFESCGGVCAADASVMENTWVRVTLVQSDTGQSIYVDRDLAGQKDIVQTLGTRRMIIGALNEEITVDLPATDGVYQGGYTGIAVYDQALTEIHINQLCDMDEGKIETDKVNKDDSILALLAGSWELGSVVSTQLMLGMSMEGLSAAGLHVAANGSLGDNFLGFDFRGVCQVDAENKDTPFLIDLEGGIYLLGKKVVECAVEFDIDHFYFKGEMDLFDWSFLTVKGEVEGSLNRSGDLLLTANENIIIAGLEVSSAVKITNSSIKMDATLLAVDFTFESSISRNNLYLEASTDFDFAIDETIDVVIPTPFGDVHLPTITINFGFDAALSIKISQSGLQVKASTGFECLGRNWSITVNLPGIPLDQSALESDLIYAIVNEIKNSVVMGVPGALETFTEWAKIAWSAIEDFAEMVSTVLKNAFSKTYNEVAKILKNGFDLPDVDIAKGLKAVGASAAEAGEALLEVGCDTIDTVLKSAMYAPSAVDDMLSDLLGCCIVKISW